MMTRSYFSEAMGSFVVFDLQQPLTLVGAKEWKKSLDNTCLQVGGSPIPVILLANKVYIPVHTCKQGIHSSTYMQTRYTFQYIHAMYFVLLYV